MVAHTVLLDFTVPTNQILDIEKQANLKSNITNVLKEHLVGLKHLTESSIDGSLVILFSGPKSSLITVRGYTEGLVTVNIEYYKPDDEEALLSFESARDLETALQAVTSATRSHTLTPIKRGGPFERYFPTADERLLEYDIDKLVFEARSPYQKVQIVHSKSLGNMLILDELQNMSEADLIYSETLMQRGKECYEDKEIVILGGGDGGLLWELLKENPKRVTMLEIDDVVIKACSQYMRSVCGDCLDKRITSKYEIIVGDCVIALNHMINEGHQVDYVFGDLTDIPISTAPHGDAWDFIRLILNSSMKVLKPTGKYMTHGNGASCPKSLKMYEEVLSQLCVPVKFTKDEAFIPSFFEVWIFYQVSLK
ncbi:PREDICTED: spermine synthase isoform X1 [Ceratosolen solmsi marchali]|uniref:Spermine synthase isoform X1 n=1 Tax=Ceratosolen solmsi marchali TaxID=326594 RepID=A0AAJ6YRM7_9HYME|nr:PREDICTED: spermine synthase isoform X1 [Ceratosolen solmsi marchali]XP_011502999.1 PREDICTED: spermine synthase isoform X1 [Ceratosolen solmsi marchali]XP_011503000.1 PREDICTED: spermine synthase isoform X1 [Ceratosolen solmsi marchali]